MKPQPKMRYAGAFAVLLALLAVLFVWNVNSGSLHPHRHTDSVP